MGLVGSEEAKVESRAHEKRLDQLAERREDIGTEETMVPYLVNITWTYDPVSGRSPGVAYSMEGIFYGWDAELTMEAARDFLMDHVVPSASYKTRGIMDLTTPESSVEPASRMQVGAMRADFMGDEFKMRVSDDMSDDRFKTNVLAFFTRSETGKQYEDKDFGYAGADIRYRWMGKRIVMD
jgi:hypothetical protein